MAESKNQNSVVTEDQNAPKKCIRNEHYLKKETLYTRIKNVFGNTDILYLFDTKLIKSIYFDFTITAMHK